MNKLYYCPICKTYSKEFLKTGKSYPVLKEKQIIGGGIRMSMCPVCKSIDRHRLTYLWLEKYFEEHNSQLNVVHIAPERPLVKYLSSLPNINYVRGDYFCPGYTYTKGTVHMDIMQLTLEDNSVDLFICNHVLEHVKDDIVAMKEIYRVLKHGGYAILQVPYSLNTEITENDPLSSPKERMNKYGQRDHVRLYGMDYPQRLKSIGFEVHTFIPSDKIKEKLKLNPNEVLWIVKKN